MLTIDKYTKTILMEIKLECSSPSSLEKTSKNITSRISKSIQKEVNKSRSVFRAPNDYVNESTSITVK